MSALLASQQWHPTYSSSACRKYLFGGRSCQQLLPTLQNRQIKAGLEVARFAKYVFAGGGFGGAANAVVFTLDIGGYIFVAGPVDGVSVAPQEHRLQFIILVESQIQLCLNTHQA